MSLSNGGLTVGRRLLGATLLGAWSALGATLVANLDGGAVPVEHEEHRLHPDTPAVLEKPLMRSSRSLVAESATSVEETQDIPQIVYVTAPDATLSGELGKLWERNKAYLPAGAVISYYNNQQMVADARSISGDLAAKGITGVFEAFQNLRPAAYRADLWRYMRLWAAGGVYMDAKIQLSRSVEGWLSFHTSNLQVVKDYSPGMLFNGIFAARKGDPALETVIKLVVSQIQQRSYGDFTPTMSCDQGGWDCKDRSPGYLAITGPLAFAKGLGLHGVVGQKGAWSFSGFSAPGSAPTISARVDVHIKASNITAVLFLDNYGHEVARSNLAVHKAMKGGSYADMWRAHQVYCTEAGPACPTY